MLSPNVKDKYRERALAEKMGRETHIQSKMNELSTPLLSSSSSSPLPKAKDYPRSFTKSSVAMIGNFVLEQQCQIGVLRAGHHKVLQWKAWVKLIDMSNEFKILSEIGRQRDYDGTGVMQLIEWGDSAASPCWLAFEYLPRTLQECLAEDGAIQPCVVAAFFIQLKHGLLLVHRAGNCPADIKPANLMVDFHSQQMKLCNFCSAVPCDTKDSDSEGENYQSYTEQYRAPELWPQCAEYTGVVTLATESWAFARCLIEALTAEPLFPTLGSIQAYWHNNHNLITTVHPVVVTCHECHEQAPEGT